MTKTVCAVLVTYNRKKCLSKVIQGLHNQTHKINRVFIFDNDSTDDTLNYLRNNEFKIIYSTSDISKLKKSDTKVVFHNNENLGGSGGFSNAINYASSFNYDYMWIMDDDVYPEPDCLQTMLDTMATAKTDASIPNRTDENYRDNVVTGIDFKNFLKYTPYSRKQIMREPATKDYYYVVDMAFEGPLIKTELVRKIGAPDDGFFLEYDDSDYAQRIQKYSRIAFVSKARLHRQLAKKGDTTFKFKGRKDQYNWRTYYTLRNNIIFDRRYGQNWMVKHISPRLLFIHKYVKSIKDGMGKNNIPILKKAYRDGMHGRMGKRIDPGY
ncbi:glycosyltransferase [Limosilactobacillus coleohominis]|uniref:glycosyltransferase n=1 Tax=Limosilactobacillus coleohominis TaxID=181675 RepID=UPI0026F2589C|nr:glycosyltransferase [Limosilactobacillus coleohominis]